MKTNVAIVVPNWNGEKLLSNCMSSLQKQSKQAHIIVVDNGSTDNSVDLLSSKYPEVQVVTNNTNKGFSGGVNTGIREALKAKYEFIALFNNDATAENDWLEKLLKTIQKDSLIGIVTGKLLQTDKQYIDSAGEQLSTRGMPFPRGRNQKTEGIYTKQEEVFGATGGASIYRSKMFNKIGLFDETFFAYFEDVDISFRAHHAGWKILYNPKAIAYHEIGATSHNITGFIRYHSIKNFLLLYLKNMPLGLFFKYLLLHEYQLIRMFGGSIRDHQVRFYLKALVKFWLLLPSTLRKRHTILKKSKIGSKEVDELLWHGKPPMAIKL